LPARPTKNDVSIMFELKVLRGATVQHARHVRMLHEPVFGDDGVEIVAEIGELQPPMRRHARDVGGDHVQQHDAFMQHLVVPTEIAGVIAPSP
jgi:hypothetical protein